MVHLKLRKWISVQLGSSLSSARQFQKEMRLSGVFSPMNVKYENFGTFWVARRLPIRVFKIS